MASNRGGWGNQGRGNLGSSQKSDKKGRINGNGNGKTSVSISCSYFKKLGHTAIHYRDKPNSSSNNNINQPHGVAEKSCDSCGKPGHTASKCWTYDARILSHNKCGTCGKMGHTTDTCQHNQYAGFSGSGNGNHGAQNELFCSFCNERSHADDICFKKQQNSSSNNNQALDILVRPLKRKVALTGNRIRDPYCPRLRVVERWGEDFWAVDSDGDVLMCTLCSGFSLWHEWCLQCCIARIGQHQQQNAELLQIPKADVVGLERAMKKNYCPR